MTSDFNILFESLINMDPNDFVDSLKKKSTINANSTSALSTESDAEKTKELCDEDFIQIVPYGLSIGNEMGPPVMIFKALDINKGDITIPLIINSLEAGVSIAQSNKSILPSSPHRGTKIIFESLGVKIKKCFVIEVRGQSQYVRLQIEGNPNLNSIKLKASDVLSLCLYLEVPIFTTKEVAARSKIMVAQIDEQKKQILSNPTIVRNKQLYIN